MKGERASQCSRAVAAGDQTVSTAAMIATVRSAPLAPDRVRGEIRSRLLAAAGEQVVAIYLHGSRVNGRARPRSDWDVVVVLRDPVDDWIARGLELAALFYDGPFSVALQLFGEREYRDDADVPGTLASAVSRRGEPLHRTADAPTDRDRSRVNRVGAR